MLLKSAFVPGSGLLLPRLSALTAKPGTAAELGLPEMSEKFHVTSAAETGATSEAMPKARHAILRRAVGAERLGRDGAVWVMAIGEVLGS